MNTKQIKLQCVSAYRSRNDDNLLICRFLMPDNIESITLLPMGIPITKEMNTTYSTTIHNGHPMIEVRLNKSDFPEIKPLQEVFCNAIINELP